MRRAATLDALADAAGRVGPPPGEDPGRPPGADPARPRGSTRWAVAPRAAAAAALAVTLLAGGVALRASTAPEGVPVELPRPRATAAGAERTAAAGEATPPGGTPAAGVTPTPAASGAPAVVHVVGAVAAPGLVTVPVDARVADAVAAAGGSTPDADLAAVNLARTVVDGEQLHVPRVGEVPAPSAGAPGTGDEAASGGTGGAGTVDLNTADLATLDGLPGVGPVLAQRILDRRARAPFTSVDELDDVSGIGPAVLERLRPLVRV
ncbi:ComEA family DNA-binding protein [Cellulomonas shaoxiangyii]|uniref:ComEA family DNA-binding protein n=1 Tax=Cellulomonas shaoxiangyii TaxID=2566013 RepID=A0A4P7SLN0_9CELL|nr:ComEA family DNA-binding protein [Cellulomonas shaoxiangyii]